MRLSWVAALVAVAALTGPGFAAEAKPNILFIAADDLRPELGCYGKTWIKSPNIDRLASRGLVFQRAYCQQAVCSPSRTSLLTGLHPDTTKVYDLETHFRKTTPGAVTLPQHFMQHGYHCASMGKIFHNGMNDEKSWSEPHREQVGGRLYVLPENHRLIAQKVRAAKDKGLVGMRFHNAAKGPPTEIADVPDADYTDGALADHAVKTLARLAETKKPFFLAVGFMRPHLPFNAPKKYWDLYDPAAIKLADNPFAPKNAPAIAATNWAELRAYETMPPKGDVSEAQARHLRHGYYACVSFLDANVGKVLDELERLKLAENTVIVLWGDHGWKLGEHGGWCKHTNYDVDANAPLIVVDPRAKAKGKSTRALVEFVDIYPSLCDLAGLPKPKELEGVSFTAALNDPETSARKAAFSQYPRGRIMGYTMKTDAARLTVWLDGQANGKLVATELYDHVKDPAENENVAEKPEYADTLKELLGVMKSDARSIVPLK
jgi:arylsulfatase A-like enzyme